MAKKGDKEKTKSDTLKKDEELQKTKLNKQAMLQALEKTLGIASTACKMCEISRQTHYRWLKEDPEYKQAVSEIDEVALDFAESQLHKRMQDRSDSAIIFYLKTKGKNRGYVERQEITGKDGAEVPSVQIYIPHNDRDDLDLLKDSKKGS